MITIILFALVATLTAFYIALRTSEKLLNWFDDLLEPIRDFFDNDSKTEE